MKTDEFGQTAIYKWTNERDDRPPIMTNEDDGSPHCKRQLSNRG